MIFWLTEAKRLLYSEKANRQGMFESDTALRRLHFGECIVCRHEPRISEKNEKADK